MTKEERLLATSKALSEKLVIVADASIGIYQNAAAHGVIYTGPTYEDELKELNSAIKEIEE